MQLKTSDCYHFGKYIIVEYRQQKQIFMYSVEERFWRNLIISQYIYIFARGIVSKFYFILLLEIFIAINLKD